MKTIIKGMPRPAAIDIWREYPPAYEELNLTDPSLPAVTTYRVETVSHAPCGWEHPTWPDEAHGRLQAHLSTCEMHAQDSEHAS